MFDIKSSIVVYKGKMKNVFAITSESIAQVLLTLDFDWFVRESDIDKCSSVPNVELSGVFLWQEL